MTAVWNCNFPQDGRSPLQLIHPPDHDFLSAGVHMRRHCLDNTTFYGHQSQCEDVTAMATSSLLILRVSPRGSLRPSLSLNSKKIPRLVTLYLKLTLLQTILTTLLKRTPPQEKSRRTQKAIQHIEVKLMPLHWVTLCLPRRLLGKCHTSSSPSAGQHDYPVRAIA